MGRIDNLNQGNLADLERRIRALETATPMNNAAIGRSGFEVYDGGTINVSNGNLVVSGTATISGVLNADGTVTLSGVIGISGPLTVTGTTALNGPTTIGGNTTVTGTLTTNGPLDVNGATTLDGNTTVTGTLTTNGPVNITGETTLTGDLNVVGAGNIQVGDNMLLLPGVAGGSIQFSAGGGVENTGGVTAIKGAGNAGLIMNTTSSLFAASNQLDVSPSAVSITGPVKLNSLTSTASDANVYFDPISKQLYYKP